MTKSFRRNVCLVAVTMLFGLNAANAEVIYSNTSNDLGTRFNTDTFEVGDQIILTSVGWLTHFSFEYWGVNTANQNGPFSGDNVQARVRFYRMDGPATETGYITPGTAFYDSGWFSVGPTERSTLNFVAGTDFSPSGLFIPSAEITWSVQFRGMGATDDLGVDIYSPPTVGQAYPDYWQRAENQPWDLLENSGGTPMNFAARFEATIPEPSSVSLLVLGGLATLIMRRRRS